MKKRILTIASMLFLAIMIPLTVNAANISVEPTEMKVGDIVTVEVEVNTANTESVQFDLDFDNSKYEYILNSAVSELDSTGSNLLDADTVRVVAFSFDSTNPVHLVKLQFKALSAGQSVPFEVVDGSLEATDATGTSTIETFAEPKVFVSKIEGLPSQEEVKKPEYFDENGKPISGHGPWGEATRAAAKKSIAGVYTKLIQNKLVVPYALPTSDDTLTIADIQAEFGSTVDVTGLTNPIKSGDKFILNGQEHIILIYGDVNKDGKVTAADALITRKYEKNILTPDEVTAITSEVGDLIEDSKAIQQFALRLRQTKTSTILEKYPVEFYTNDIDFAVPSQISIHRGTRTLIGTIAALDGRTITKELLSTITIPNVTIETIDNAGKVEIWATSNSTNTFNIAPTLTGKNIENGQITKGPESISVDEVKTVNAISLFDQDGNEIKDELNLASGQSKMLTIKYYHIYEDGTKVELTEENTSSTYFDVNKVRLQQLPSPTIFDRNSTVLVNSAENPTTSGIHFIHALNIKSVLGQTGSEDLTITVTNDTTYLNDYNWEVRLTKVLKVTVADEQATKLKINNEVKDDGDSFDLNIYKVAQTNNPNVYCDPDTGHYFTIFNINLISDGAAGKTPLTNPILSLTEKDKYLYDTNSFIISQDSDELAFDIDVKYFMHDSNGYTPVDPGGSDIQYIGISYFDDYDTNIDSLSEGLTLYYGGTEVNGTVKKEEVHINIHGITTDLGATQTPSNSANPFDDATTGSNLVAPLSEEASEEPEVLTEASEEPEVSAEPSEEPEVSTEPSEEPEVSAEPSEEPEVSTEPSQEPSQEATE